MQTISLEHISWFLGQKRIYIISMHTSNPSIFYGLNETCVDFINILLLLKPYNYVSNLQFFIENVKIFLFLSAVQAKSYEPTTVGWILHLFIT